MPVQSGSANSRIESLLRACKRWVHLGLYPQSILPAVLHCRVRIIPKHQDGYHLRALTERQEETHLPAIPPALQRKTRFLTTAHVICRMTDPTPNPRCFHPALSHPVTGPGPSQPEPLLSQPFDHIVPSPTLSPPYLLPKTTAPVCLLVQYLSYPPGRQPFEGQRQHLPTHA